MGTFPRLFPSNFKCCGADATYETAVQAMPRGRPPVIKRAKQIFHGRIEGEDRHNVGFWHWSDQTDLQQATVALNAQGGDPL